MDLAKAKSEAEKLIFNTPDDVRNYFRFNYIILSNNSNGPERLKEIVTNSQKLASEIAYKLAVITYMIEQNPDHKFLAMLLVIEKECRLHLIMTMQYMSVVSEIFKSFQGHREAAKEANAAGAEIAKNFSNIDKIIDGNEKLILLLR